LLMDLDEMSILYRGPSIDTSYQVSVHLAEGFQRRRLKGEKLTDDKWWQKLRLKIKFYLFGIAARPTEKLAAQIILFAFQTIFFIIKKIGIVPEFRSCPQSLFRALFISNLDHKSAWCTLYWEQTFKRHGIENGLLKRK
jgi:hypothetical protein